MPNKKKNKKLQKNKLESQYEKLFKLLSNNTPIPRKTSAPLQLQTWVTYSAFEDPII